jgi:hypothetical protein
MAARYTNEPGALSMNVLDEPVVALMVLVVVGFLFLLCLSKGSLSEREQTGVWVVFTLLFFSLCSLLVRSDTQRGKANHAEMPLLWLIQNGRVTPPSRSTIRDRGGGIPWRMGLNYVLIFPWIIISQPLRSHAPRESRMSLAVAGTSKNFSSTARRTRIGFSSSCPSLSAQPSTIRFPRS